METYWLLVVLLWGHPVELTTYSTLDLCAEARELVIESVFHVSGGDIACIPIAMEEWEE